MFSLDPKLEFILPNEKERNVKPTYFLAYRKNKGGKRKGEKVGGETVGLQHRKRNCPG